LVSDMATKAAVVAVARDCEQKEQGRIRAFSERAREKSLLLQG
jgi:hypothetical protein